MTTVGERGQALIQNWRPTTPAENSDYGPLALRVVNLDRVPDAPLLTEVYPAWTRFSQPSRSAGGVSVLRSDARIDLLITDIALPGGVNGREMTDIARSMRPKPQSAVHHRLRRERPTEQRPARAGYVGANQRLFRTPLDRLLHHSQVLTMLGDSYRLRERRRSRLIKTDRLWPCTKLQTESGPF